MRVLIQSRGFGPGNQRSVQPARAWPSFGILGMKSWKQQEAQRRNWLEPGPLITKFPGRNWEVTKSWLRPMRWNHNLAVHGISSTRTDVLKPCKDFLIGNYLVWVRFGLHLIHNLGCANHILLETVPASQRWLRIVRWPSPSWFSNDMQRFVVPTFVWAQWMPRNKTTMTLNLKNNVQPPFHSQFWDRIVKQNKVFRDGGDILKGDNIWMERIKEMEIKTISEMKRKMQSGMLQIAEWMEMLRRKAFKSMGDKERGRGRRKEKFLPNDLNYLKRVWVDPKQ